jgi:hypothetical protein
MKIQTLFAAGLLLCGTTVSAFAAPPDPAPAPPPPGAPGARPDDEVAGERCLDEAARWIAKGENPPDRLLLLHCDIDYQYDDGQTQDERRMELWFRNPDAFRANTKWGGRDSTLLLKGETGYLIRDRLHVSEVNKNPATQQLLPMMKNYRAILQEVGRLMAPAGLKSPGARFRLLGTVQDPRASGGAWFKVQRTAPREGDMTFFFGSAPRRDGTGVRAIAPDKLVLAGEPGSNYAGDEYRLQDWVHDNVGARNEQFRYPRKMQLFAIGIDPENKPTMRASINFLEVNTPVDPKLFEPY